MLPLSVSTNRVLTEHAPSKGSLIYKTHLLLHPLLQRLIEDDYKRTDAVLDRLQMSSEKFGKVDQRFHGLCTVVKEKHCKIKKHFIKDMIFSGTWECRILHLLS